MLFPSLPADVAERLLVTPGGEIAILPGDADAFLAACELDGRDVLGWELWLVDVRRPGDGAQRPEAGIWGVVPSWALLDGGPPRVYGGSGDARRSRAQIAALRLEQEIRPEWLAHVRINVTLAEGHD